METKVSLDSLQDRDLARMVRQIEGVAVGLAGLCDVLEMFSDFDPEALGAFRTQAAGLEDQAKAFAHQVDQLLLSRG